LSERLKESKMSDFEEKDYKIFEMFRKDWALVTAGTIDSFNACTIAWGSMGTIWQRPGHCGQTLTVYLHPSRYTQQVMQGSDYFTVSFFPKDCRAALEYMGSHTGRNEDKAANAGLTPVPCGSCVTFEEAELTFECHKIYAHQLDKESLDENVREYYKNRVVSFPVDENGDWQPHWVYMGEIVSVTDKR